MSHFIHTHVGAAVWVTMLVVVICAAIFMYFEEDDKL